jgi:plastocyanin
MADVKFVPSCFTASASQGIHLVNEDDVAHTFTMLNTDIDVRVEAGQTFDGQPVTGIVEPGKYQLVCRLHGSMQGVVTVTGPASGNELSVQHG